MDERAVNSETHRDALDAADALRKEYMAVARDDDASAMQIELEQARLLAFATLGALGVVWTALFSTSRVVCIPYVQFASTMLGIAASFGWGAISRCAAARSMRSAMLVVELEAMTAARTGKSSDNAATRARAALDETQKHRGAARGLTLAGAILGWAALALLFEAARQAIRGFCSPPFWDQVPLLLQRLA